MTAAGGGFVGSVEGIVGAAGTLRTAAVEAAVVVAGAGVTGVTVFGFGPFFVFADLLDLEGPDAVDVAGLFSGGATGGETSALAPGGFGLALGTGFDLGTARLRLGERVDNYVRLIPADLEAVHRLL